MTTPSCSVTRQPTTTRARTETCEWMTQSSLIRAPAPMTTLGCMTVRAPIDAPAPIVTNGPIDTSSPIAASAATELRGSTEKDRETRQAQPRADVVDTRSAHITRESRQARELGERRFRPPLPRRAIAPLTRAAPGEEMADHAEQEVVADDVRAGQQHE